jgi:anthranilate synthase component 1
MPATPSFAEFDQLARASTLIPVFRTLTADLETPVSAFLRLAQAGDNAAPEAFLFESVEGGEHVARWTFMGIDPYRTMSARGHAITVSEGGSTRHAEGDLFEQLKQDLAAHTPARLPGLPPFTAGAVGFFAYDVVRLIERLPATAPDELGVPDAHLMFFDQVVAMDNVRNEVILICTADLTRGHTYSDAVARLDRLEALLARPLPQEAYAKPAESVRTPLELTPRTTRTDFLTAVDRAKEYVASGDVFQCVLSQRFDCLPGVAPFDIYRALRVVNPSPYMFFLCFPLAGKPAHVVGASPELLVRVKATPKGSQVEYRPIAGTRRRAADEAEDRALEADLRADAKEVAEHVMLVDLGRNDVGRVSQFGSVRVKELMFVERYSHVMHLVSSIEGTLRPELAPIDAFKACFPAGTLSGAPKIRAMEIIEELEPARRGIYGGSIFYADFSGNLDSCIAIRTLFQHGARGHIQAGAGIVADSVPESEYEECRSKAQAVVRAIERARGL